MTRPGAANTRSMGAGFAYGDLCPVDKAWQSRLGPSLGLHIDEGFAEFPLQQFQIAQVRTEVKIGDIARDGHRA